MTQEKPRQYRKLAQSRMCANDRREQLLRGGLAVAERIGYMLVSRRMIGEELQVSETLVPKHVGTTEDMINGIVQLAVAEGSIPVIAQALAMQHPYVKGGLAPETMRKVQDYLAS